MRKSCHERPYEEEVGLGYPDKEKNDRQMYWLSQELGVPVTAVQMVDINDWNREDDSFARETRKMVADIKAGRTGYWEAKARAQMKASRRNG